MSKTKATPSKKMPHINNLTLTTFIKNYNEKYSESISEHQQRLLNKYILSFSDNGLELKAYLNEEVVRLKEEVSTLIANEDLTTDSDVRDKMKQVHAMLESFRLNKLDQNLITKILKIQNLIREANE